ncbi:unnamed protein product [Trichobilharzia regenti]|nr:unnamed protein product [Trichobilharzia regenti]
MAWYLNLQITPNSINPVNQSTHNLTLNEQTGLLASSLPSSFPTTQTSQTTPYPPILILNPLQSNYCPQIALTAATTTTPTLSNPTSIQTFLPITTTTATSSSSTTASTISFSNHTILPKLEDSNSQPITTSYPNSIVPNGTDENIDPLDSPESIDSSQYQIKHTNEPLNTFEIASTVRDLLIKHNISQRQFSKHVLKLSQGTMSELLSKPRPWYRLTARGRDSFRRLQAWILDPNNISSFKTYQRKRTSKSFVCIGIYLCVVFVSLMYLNRQSPFI